MYSNNPAFKQQNNASAPPLPIMDEIGAREYLTTQKWPSGLQDVFVNNLTKIPIRYFICDDSGSMAADGGKKPTEFRFLNDGVPVVLGSGNADEASKYNELMRTLADGPSGGTPLSAHIGQVIASIRKIEPQLRANRQKACIVIATDGESSDGDVATALRPLHHLPVWVVIRLCTNDENVVNYWNNIDSQLELDMDVLNDLFGEAKEVHKHNPWIT